MDAERIDLRAGCACGYDPEWCRVKWQRRYYDGGSMAAVLTTDTYADLLARVKNGLRDARKAARLGYTVRTFEWAEYLEDICAIHHSRDVRCGGKMRGHYRNDLDEMRANLPAALAPCSVHWRLNFGVFAPGDTLVGYINLTRVGDLAAYMQIMGHGDHLDNGVMFLLHFRLMEWALTPALWMDGAKAIFYTAFSGPPGLDTWKRKAGFVEVRL